MTLEPWLLFAHITGAVIWVGGGVMLTVFGGRARQSGDIATINEFARTLSYVGPRVLAPAVVVVLLSGIWLVVQQSREFTQLWILLALGAFAAAFVIGAVYLSRSAILLESLATDTTADPRAVRDALGRWMLGYAVVLAILVFALWDMIFKPGL
jgi:uncharacterized membrane protein